MRLHVTIIGAAVLAALCAPPVLAEAPLAGDPAAGKKIYSQICVACHSNKEGQNRIGPSLWGAYGRKAASLPGFEYSAALKAANLVWDTPTLLKWEAGAAKFVPGTKMSYAGLQSPEDQKNIIAYLQTLH